jgi:hypothetical protein
MEDFKTYTMEECNRYLVAKTILGNVTVECNELYRLAETKEEKEAIREFERPYATLRHSLLIDDKKTIDMIYNEVKPIIQNITLDYILQTIYAEAI